MPRRLGAAFDPATILMLISILSQLGKLLAWWKPQWVINWQMDRVIKAHLDDNTTYSLSAGDIKRAIIKSKALEQISLW